ncbi:membrane protein insertion efficiency factor YidD [Micromonospora sp. NPDC048830]|uniref:membrane protein insertion efficiency factor YidD n=1 Tax=Micromonospora sp. NPDC048830 TaxID=3364257 RepID=UPI0037121FCA
MFSLKRKQHRKKKRGSGSSCDGCDACDCDGPDCCDFGLFSFMLTLGSVAAGAAARLPGAGAGRSGPGAGCSGAGAGRSGASGPDAGRSGASGPDAGRSGATRVPVVDRAGRAAILGYRRWLSHRWPGQCRYTPTCSAYGLAAVERYGLAVGGRMAADRLRRCKPDVPRGTYDPVR